MSNKGEQYGPGWAYIALMVHENGEIHAVGGDRRGDDPDADLPYIGLERIDALLSNKGKTHIALSAHKQVTQAPDVSSELIKELAKMCGLIPAHTTAEWVSTLVRFVRVVLDNNSVQEAFVRANAGLLAEATDEMIDAACAAVPGMYRVDAMKAIEAALAAMNASKEGA